MAFCTKCGRKIEEHFKVCPNCGTPLRGNKQEEPVSNYKYRVEPTYKEEDVNNTYINANYNNQNKSYRSLRMTTIMSEGEEIIRSYECCRSNATSGYIYVSNKRVIYSSSYNNSRVSSEVALESVSGIDSSYGTNYNIIKIVFGIIIIIVGIIIASSLYNTFGSYGDSTFSNISIIECLVAVVIGGYCIYSGIQKCFKLQIYSSEATGAPISIGVGALSLFGNQASFSYLGEPTRDTNQMLDELGAMIIDLQENGDYAIEKWKQ